jgi:hypothetical protein
MIIKFYTILLFGINKKGRQFDGLFIEIRKTYSLINCLTTTSSFEEFVNLTT